MQISDIVFPQLALFHRSCGLYTQPVEVHLLLRQANIQAKNIEYPDQ